MPIGIGTTGRAAMIAVIVAVSVAVFIGILEEWFRD